ncbi:MAG: histone deacetylase [Anaerolineae bacterium]|jgi:acetoin utilization deacetylase AcuC-like enzyme|nr:histone deacetylase [Anaerolineae bacterium]
MTTAYITHSRCVEHNIQGHPEHAGRLRSIWQKLEAGGLISQLHLIEAQPVTDEMIRLVHTEDYLNMLKWIPTQEHIVQFDPDTYALPVSPEIARLSAGGVVTAVDAIMSGRAVNALVAVRPPGHHALPERGMGFCLLGNVPIGARYAQQHYGLQRVMIVDFDVHHGNGTQDMFYDDPSVLFVSTHQFPFYPGTGGLNETGTGKGAGYTLNIPLAQGHGDVSYLAIYEDVLWPAAQRFQPELIIVSAGFDAHWTDPLAMMRLSLTGYAQLSYELVKMADQLCGGKIIFALEGGYDLNAVGYGMRNVAHALLKDDEVDDPLGLRQGIEPDIMPLLDRVRRIHKF